MKIVNVFFLHLSDLIYLIQEVKKFVANNWLKNCYFHLIKGDFSRCVSAYDILIIANVFILVLDIESSKIYPKVHLWSILTASVCKLIEN